MIYSLSERANLTRTEKDKFERQRTGKKKEEWRRK